MSFEVTNIAVFDCDGVVLQSNHLKTDAFRRALDGEPKELVDRFVAYHKSHGGVSRYRKFEHYFSAIRPASYTEAEVDDAVSRYARIVEEGLLTCPEVPGVRAALAAFDKTGNVYLVSGGDQDELRKVFAERDLDRHLNGIFGSPSTKQEILASMMSTLHGNVKGVYFGDSELDLMVSEEFGLEFVLVAGTSEWKEGRVTCAQRACVIIEDFTEPACRWMRG